MSRLNVATVGPFLRASNALEDFGSNIYFSAILQETISQHLQIESELKEAREAEDAEKVHQLEMDLALLEGAYQLSSLAQADHNQ